MLKNPNFNIYNLTKISPENARFRLFFLKLQAF